MPNQPKSLLPLPTPSLHLPLALLLVLLPYLLYSSCAATDVQFTIETSIEGRKTDCQLWISWSVCECGQAFRLGRVGAEISGN